MPYDFNISNVFECGRNNPAVSYEKSYMATYRDEYFTEMLDVTAKNRPVKIFEKQLSESWKKKKNKLNVTSITLNAVLYFSLRSL